MVDDAQGSPPIEQNEVEATAVPPKSEATPEPKRKPFAISPGAPSLYSDELAETICTRISNGDTLTGMCLEDGMPDRNTVYGWLETKPAFSYAFQQARYRAAHAMADELRHLAKVGGESAEREMAAIKWLLPRWLPHDYGEKIALGISQVPMAEPGKVIDNQLAPEVAPTHSLGGQVLIWKRSANGSG